MDFHVGKNIPSIYMDPSCLWARDISKKSPTGPTERTPKPKYLRSRSQLPERGPLGFGPIQFLMEIFPLPKAARICFTRFNLPTKAHQAQRSQDQAAFGLGVYIGGAGFLDPKTTPVEKRGWIPGAFEKMGMMEKLRRNV